MYANACEWEKQFKVFSCKKPFRVSKTKAIVNECKWMLVVVVVAWKN